jgi:opacity protein-like surface antigen
MKAIQLITLVFVMVGIMNNTRAQEGFAAEFRPGINFPIQELDGADLTTGYGFEAKVSYWLMPHLSAYAGWGWNQFNVKETNSSDPKIDVDETGYTVGFELTLPIGEPPIYYFVNAGAVYNHIELENNTTNAVLDTDHGIGWQMGGGIAYEFVENWQLRPEIRFRSLSRELMIENVNSDLKLKYIGFGIGVLAKF